MTNISTERKSTMDPLTDRETAETYKRVNEIVREEMEEAVKRQKLRDAAPALAEALAEALNALLDYVPTLEAKGASLAYGHSVIAHARAALLAAGYSDGKADGRI
jgi:hypothetical protein